jgi:hypothetical protein
MEMGVGEGGGMRRSYSFLDKSGVRMGCTLGGVHGEGVGDRVWSRILGIGGELCDGRGAACLG